MENRWYIIQVVPGSEKKVCEDIKDQMQKKNLSHCVERIFVPSENHDAYRKGKKVSIERKVFPGYILIKMIMNEDSWHAVKRVNKVNNFLGAGDRPKPLPDAEVERIFQQIEEGAFMKQNALTFSLGDLVKVTDGPFESLVGTVEDVDVSKERLVVSVSIWGRATKIDLQFSQVTKSEE